MVLANQQNLRVATSLHQILEICTYLTDPDFVRKTLGVEQHQANERAVARRFVSLYRVINDAIGLPEAILRTAIRMQPVRKLIPLPQRSSPDAKLSRGLLSVFQDRIKDVDLSDILLVLALLYLASIRDTARDAGFIGITPEGVGNPVDVFVATDIAQVVEESVLAGFLTYIATLANMYSAAAFMVIAGKVTRKQVARTLRSQTRRLMGNSIKVQVKQISAQVSNSTRAQASRRNSIKERRLITMRDDRVCPICIGDAAQRWIPITQAYHSGAMHPPQQHFGCRCREQFKKPIEQQLAFPEFYCWETGGVRKPSGSLSKVIEILRAACPLGMREPRPTAEALANRITRVVQHNGKRVSIDAQGYVLNRDGTRNRSFNVPIR